MEIYRCLIFFLMLGYSFCGYTGYTLMLWLSSDEDLSPVSVWSDANSLYNSNIQTTTQDLQQKNIQGYRYTLIDSWSENPPDKIRLAFRNRDGKIIHRMRFKSTGSSSNGWFTATKALNDTWEGLSYDITRTFTSYSVDFATSSNNWGATRYQVASLRLNNGSVIYIVGSSAKLAFLPAVPSASGDCFASYQDANQFAINFTTNDLTHDFCSAFCRERDYSDAGAHNKTCFCLDQPVTGPSLSICNIPCEGNDQESCGGTAPPAVIFNSVNTNIDVSQFDKPLTPHETIEVMGNSEVSFPGWTHLYGFNISISTAHLPATIQMVLYYNIGQCNGTKIDNSTLRKSFTVTVGEFTLELEPLLVHCVYILLLDNSTTEALTFPVNMTTIILEDSRFVTAQFLTIEAAWSIVEEEPECECECWVYNLLYGDSPFNNMSYDEIEVALRNVTEKLEKELTVNKTTLSSTIRKKTSAEDNRPSAVAVGYCLGVALLVTSLGAILLTDFPKMLQSFSILKGNLKSRFGKQDLQFDDNSQDLADTGQKKTNY